MRKIFAVFVVFAIGFLVFLSFKIYLEVKNLAEVDETSKLYFDFAEKLLEKGLKSEAIVAFEKYLEKAKIEKNERISILYRLATIHLELGNYSEALKNFYKIEALKPQEEFSKEVRKKIKEIEEKLNIDSLIEKQKAEETSQDESTEDPVVAKVGNRLITESEIQAALKILPAWLKEDLAKDPEAKKEFIKNYVVQEILYQKAKSLGMDKKDSVRKVLQQTEKQIVVGEFFAQYINEKLKLTDEELKSYYEANRSSYVEPAELTVKFLSFAKESEKEDVVKKIKENDPSVKKLIIKRTDREIQEIGKIDETILESLFATKVDSFTEPIKIADTFYVFYIENKKESYIQSFEEVKDRVAEEYKEKKEQEILDELIKQTLEQQEVEIF